MGVKKLFERVLGVITLVFAITVFGCQFGFDGKPDLQKTDYKGTELTRHDYLALLKTQESHKVDIEKLEKLVYGVLETTEAGRSAASRGGKITGVNKLSVGSSKRFIGYAGAGRSAMAQPETEPVEIYEFSITSPDSENFVLASNDDRIGNILAIAEGSLEDAPAEFAVTLNAHLNDYIDSTIVEYNSISEAEIESAIEKAIAVDLEGARALASHWSLVQGNIYVSSYSSNFNQGKGELLVTKWGQGTIEPYDTDKHAYNNYVRRVDNDITHVTGCAPTAIAQIIAYNNYIGNVATDKPAAFNDSQIGEWSGTYDLSIIRSMGEIKNSSPPRAKAQVAVLMYQIGKLGSAVYQSKLTTIDPQVAKSVFEKLGYTITHSNEATSLSETSNSSTITYITTPATIKTALDNNRPIYIEGFPKIGKTGHAWVIDGWGNMTYYCEEVYNTTTGQYITYYITLNNCLMVHCNLGWNGKANGWYVYGIFDADNRTLLEISDDGVKGEFSTKTFIVIPKKP